MASRPIAPKPWLDRQNASSSSIVSQGMEIGIAPGQEAPAPAILSRKRYSEPEIRGNGDRHGTWNRVAGNIAEQRRRVESPVPVSRWSSSAGTSEQVSPRSSYKQEQALQPRPQARGQPARMVKQLIGSAVGYEKEKGFPRMYKQPVNQVASEAGEDSDGSVYSQTEAEVVNTNSGNSTRGQNRENDYNQSLDAQQRARTLMKLQQNAAPSAEDIITLQQILEEQQMRCEQDIHLEIGILISKPLAIRTKKPKRISILKSAKDSLEWGINELTTPRQKRHNNTPVKERFSMHSGNTTPEEMPPTPPPKSPRRKKKDFRTGQHPLKSLFPFSGEEEDDVMPSPSQSRFGSKISGAVKSFSGRRASLAQTKKTVIPNKARKSDAPDTPLPLKLPLKSNFVDTIYKGNEQLHDMIEKTKKNVLRTAGEKRRDELKKTIMVVGIGDQSPDGRVSEWL